MSSCMSRHVTSHHKKETYNYDLLGVIVVIVIRNKSSVIIMCNHQKCHNIDNNSIHL